MFNKHLPHSVHVLKKGVVQQRFGCLHPKKPESQTQNGTASDGFTKFIGICIGNDRHLQRSFLRSKKSMRFRWHRWHPIISALIPASGGLYDQSQSCKIIAGWWLSPTPLKNMKASWNYYSQYMGKMFQTMPCLKDIYWPWSPHEFLFF